MQRLPPLPLLPACVLSLLVLLAGCASPGSGKTLTIAVNAGVEGTALKTAAREWGELRNTRIEVVELPYANLFEKESLDLTSRTGAYDVIMLDDPWFPKLVAEGGLTPLPREPDADFLPVASRSAVIRSVLETITRCRMWATPSYFFIARICSRNISWVRRTGGNKS
jgi:ABC-type glycerol-3-phosphate transport system substrate-binding protein